jgi:GINS complex protein helical bundle domain
LAENFERVGALFERRERDFLVAKTRVSVKTALENIDAGDYKIEAAKEGDTTDLPRWMAEELAELKLVEIVEEPFETELFRALSREKMMGPLQLAQLQQDFYLRMRRRLRRLAASAAEGKGRKDEYDRLRAGCYDLIGMRLSKLLSLSSSSTSASSLTDKITPEESSFFSTTQSISREWRGALLGGA